MPRREMGSARARGKKPATSKAAHAVAKTVMIQFRKLGRILCTVSFSNGTSNSREQSNGKHSQCADLSQAGDCVG